ncbi:DUF962 domain-containing protein [Marivirga sp. S37H4]|uniref:DUF962 domain-containing protein n=1 Tax=Marivirga aurantiaca TaxID=2802615 RepID=A0A934WVL7_9BACT|nr:Mpo1-like protein [Marivirga aurantiaca]MBK6263864.1 DUF962 domain-containing protein [Marivirga aurantiaca]
MRKIDALLDEYGESHKNAFNKKVHWICVPLIFWSVVALLYSIPNDALTYAFGDGYLNNWAVVVLIFALIYYFTLSVPLAIGLFLFAVLCLSVARWVTQLDLLPLWAVGLIVFFLAWVGQFYGHKIEGKKPSFLKDLQFLLIGPAWLLHFIYKKLGINY